MSVRKHWMSPRLLVLGRGMPEESVLMGCKHASLTVNGPNANNVGCKVGMGNCSLCSSMDKS
jgi:hypothetical protein